MTRNGKTGLAMALPFCSLYSTLLLIIVDIYLNSQFTISRRSYYPKNSYQQFLSEEKRHCRLFELEFAFSSEPDFARGPRAGDDIAYVRHAGDILNKPFKAEAEACMRG